MYPVNEQHRRAQELLGIMDDSRSQGPGGPGRTGGGRRPWDGRRGRRGRLGAVRRSAAGRAAIAGLWAGASLVLGLSTWLGACASDTDRTPTVTMMASSTDPAEITCGEDRDLLASVVRGAPSCGCEDPGTRASCVLSNGSCPNGTVCDPLKGYRCVGLAEVDVDPEVGACPTGYTPSDAAAEPDADAVDGGGATTCLLMTPLPCRDHTDCPVGAFCNHVLGGICDMDCEPGTVDDPSTPDVNESCECHETRLGNIFTGGAGTGDFYQPELAWDGPPEKPAPRPALVVGPASLRWTRTDAAGTEVQVARRARVRLSFPEGAKRPDGDPTVRITAGRGFMVACPATVADDATPPADLGAYDQECDLTYPAEAEDRRTVWVTPVDRTSVTAPELGQLRATFLLPGVDFNGFVQAVITETSLFLDEAPEHLDHPETGRYRGTIRLIETGSTRNLKYARRFGLVQPRARVELPIEAEVFVGDVTVHDPSQGLDYTGPGATVLVKDESRTITPDGKVRVTYMFDPNVPDGPMYVSVAGGRRFVGEPPETAAEAATRVFLTYEGVAQDGDPPALFWDDARQELSGMFGLRIVGTHRTADDVPDPVLGWRFELKRDGALAVMDDVEPPAEVGPDPDARVNVWLEALRQGLVPQDGEWGEWLTEAHAGGVAACGLKLDESVVPSQWLCETFIGPYFEALYPGDSSAEATQVCGAWAAAVESDHFPAPNPDPVPFAKAIFDDLYAPCIQNDAGNPYACPADAGTDFDTTITVGGVPVTFGAYRIDGGAPDLVAEGLITYDAWRRETDRRCTERL